MLFYRQLGQGSPLIILHGLFGSSDNWLTIAKQLAEKHTVYLLDQRNHGQSFWDNEWNYEVMSQDLAHFVTQHSLERFNLIGHSMGGKTAMHFATQYPELLEKLVVVDIAPRYYPIHHDTIIKGLQAIDLAQLQTRQEADKQLATFVAGLDSRQFLLKNLYRNENNQWAWRVNLEVIAQNIDNVGEALQTEVIFEKPTLFISGEKSDYIQEEDKPLIIKHFPKALIQNIAQSGHWVHAEQPQTFLQTINTFL